MLARKEWIEPDPEYRRDIVYQSPRRLEWLDIVTMMGGIGLAAVVLAILLPKAADTLAHMNWFFGHLY
ncbi:hypothetical protein A2765_05575 [Candidatus Kaiserbacteria bacterium RIFCSPHIGHO2_01_FULL_56_24]|uniref:Uncharacterized protein n=1 Tax=Candidatus Kaiserbacteria bacterium RIFCSPHIGHO2_01_FULL_56_24 TaxID=1798487 RepID=A0A1F6DAD5_9BACT|nr:MAG: hypothetical protein A2765_05575 [Candidatus Kaiserbacteria bacterium RIFCSPHIGHO2_01_FULL_56_24]